MKCSIVLAFVVGIAFAAGSHWSGPIDPDSPGSWQGRPGSDPNLRIVDEPTEQSPAPEGKLDWGNDILVDDVDSVRQVRLDWHESDKIICFLRWLGDTRHTNIRAYNSGDGLLWTRGTKMVSSYGIPTFDIACCSSHVYQICYLSSSPNYIKMYRFTGDDARMDTFPDGEWFFNVDTFPTSDTVVDVAIVSNRYYTDDLLFIGAITDDNRMHFYRVDIETFTVSNIGPGEYPANAVCGLDMCWNEGFPLVTYPLLFTYVNTSNRIACYGFTFAGADTHMFAVSTPTSGAYTALSAYRDTFMFVYDYSSSFGLQARYLTSYDRGANWRWGVFGDTTEPTVRSADITGRNGDGQAVVYWQYPQSTGGVNYTTRPYYGRWSPPVRIQDYSSFANVLPAVERIAPGVHGIVYIRAQDFGKAYFDRNDWTGVEERGGGGRMKAEQRRPTIVRNVLCLPSAESGQQKVAGVLLDATGRRVLDLSPGANDISEVLPGIYFVRSEGTPALNQKVVVAR